MNKSAIKGFSVRARRKLIEDISQKAYALGIKGTGKYDDIEEFEGGFRVKNAVNQIIYPLSSKKDREKLIAEINRKGFEQVVEEVAYTWFNRIIAIRFMEINEYLPVKVRMLSSEVEGKTEPDVITHIYDYVTELELDGEKVFNLKENHKDEELFKYVFVKECNNLGNLMPQVFEAIGDYTELLLPDQLLSSGSIIRDLVESIDEEDFREEVEIIGWMYQYYISEKKDEVFAALKNNKKITKENIPAATQLFTPKWIVKYMTENSLGRLWQELHPDETLKQKWEYYIEPAEQEPEVQKKLDELKNPNLSPEEIKILDPAMGSGHILVYAFDLLYDMYLSRGYAERDIPQLILEKNLYGLDIDDRAAQLASFALLMKARSKNRRFFRTYVELNVCSIHESNGFSKEAFDYLVHLIENQKNRFSCFNDVIYLIEVFKDAKEYGSILDVEMVEFNSLKKQIQDIGCIESKDIFEFANKNEILSVIPKLIKQARIMSQKYDIVITNPPYMGRKGMNSNLIRYIDENYNQSKNDLFAVFMEKALKYTVKSGYWSMINQHSWMFLTGYQNLRETLQSESSILNMIHLGPRAFEEIGGEVVQSTAFVIKNSAISEMIGTYIRVVDEKDASLKQVSALNIIKKYEDEDRYLSKMSSYKAIPGAPIVYWASNKMLEIFSENKSVKDFGKPCKGIDTGDNSQFLRLWHEVHFDDIGLNFNAYQDAINSMKKYYPYNKGGGYRKWYGNNDYVLFWNGDGSKLKSFPKSNLRNQNFYMKSGLTWSTVTSNMFSIREFGYGFFFDNGGSCLFTDKKLYLMALLNSVVFESIQKISPTLNFQPGDIGRVPVIISNENYDDICELSNKCKFLVKKDWDSSEISWDFKKNSIVERADHDKTLRNIIESCIENKLTQQIEIKSYEEHINQLFIEIYDLESELSSNVDTDTLSIQIKQENELVKELISFAVGCIFGRYSLNEEGLIYAGGQFDQSRYSLIKPTEDNITLITEDDYTGNDILHRFVDFLKVTFSEDMIEENLRYIAEVLNPKSKDTPRQTIRNYFVKDFYNDHLKMYKNRPIYWMIDSGKQNGIKALFYMHRYDKSTIARFRTDYLHEIQRYYENDIELTEKSNDKKKVDNLKKKLQEVTEFDKVVAHIAHQQIEFYLDDGVDHNYELFQGVEVPQGDGQKPMKADLLAKRK